MVVAVAMAGSLLAGCGGGAEGTGTDEQQSSLRSLEPPEFARTMSDPGTTLVDVSTAGEFRDAHIDGARNISIADDDFEEQVEALDPDQTYALYCADDARSGRAMRVMAEHGLTRVYDLDGGMRAWMAYGGAVTQE